MSEGNGNGHRPPLRFAPTVAVPIVGLPFALESWFVQILIMCKCEHPGPVLIIGQPGQAAGQCRSCHRIYGLAAIGIDAQTQQPNFQLTISVPQGVDCGRDEVRP
jgi:hypothetical protein